MSGGTAKTRSCFSLGCLCCRAATEAKLKQQKRADFEFKSSQKAQNLVQ